MYLIDQEIYSGDSVEIKRFKQTQKPKKRGTRSRITSDKQKLLNDIHGRMRLTRLINENFSYAAKDVFATLEFPTPVDHRAAKIVKERFLRAMREEMNRSGKPLKYIMVYEHGERRPHYHFIVNHIDYDTLLKIWKEASFGGGVWYEYIHDRPDHEALAVYLTKQSRRKNSPKWSCSKNLQKPKYPEPKLAKGKHIRIPKGYKEIYRIFKDSEFSGLIEYVKAVRVDRPMPKAEETYAYDRGGTVGDIIGESRAEGARNAKTGKPKKAKA